MSATPERRPSLLRDRTDARALLAYLGVTLVLAFAVQHPIAVATFATGVWLVIAGILEPAEYRSYLAYGGLSGLGVLVLNPLVSRAGVTVLWTTPAVPLIGAVGISAEAIVFGVVAGLRLLTVVGVFALYSLLVDPDTLYRLIAPLSLGSALVTALSIRLLPTSARDAARISDAMRARGLALDSGSYTGRVRARGPVVEALLMTSLDRAMGLAESLESRGFGRAGRTRLPLPALAPRDRALVALTVAIAVLGGLFAVATARFSYYPVLGEATRLPDLVTASVLGGLVALPLAFEWGWDAWLSSRSNG